MKSILGGKLAPMTFAMGFVDVPLEKATAALVEWVRTFQHDIRVVPISSSLERALTMLLPLTGLRRRELLLSTDSPWTAYIDNLPRGPDPFGPVSHLCDLLKCRGVTVACQPNTMTKQKERERQPAVYGAVGLTLFAPHKTEFLNIERSIYAANDGGSWVFRESGKAQPFETPQRYAAKRIADRFTDEMLEEYCAALGIRLFDPNFYGTSGTLINISDPMPGLHQVFLSRKHENCTAWSNR